MSSGIATPSQGFTAEQHWRDFTRGQDQARAQEQHTALGRRLVTRGQVADLPAALVEAARRAIDVERSAQQALAAKTATAQQEVARYGYQGVDEQSHLNTARGPSLYALEQATREADRACAALGEVRVAGLRQALREVEGRRAEAKRAYDQALAAIAADEAQARAELRQLGIE